VLTGQHTVNVAWDCSSDWVSVNVLYYPGTRMAHAAETGNSRGLSADEFAALTLAQRVVEGLEDMPDYEAEIAIHNWLCENVDYENAPEYTGGPVPRMCTAVGALLDGRANCQGYSDAFWLLGKLAGLNVRRQDGWCEGLAHQWNLIELDGEWYIVDITHDDMDDPAVWQYMWMNVGLDLAVDYEWNADEEVAPVAEITDGDTFYYMANGLQFADAAQLAESAVDMWREEPGVPMEGMIVDALCTTQDLHNALGAAFQAADMSGSWTLWRVNGGGNTYCRIVFYGE